MSGALDQLADVLAPETLLADVQRAWPQVVGPAIAEQSQPNAERGGVITVSCAASVWAQELDLMAPEIVRSLNDALARGRVVRLRCVATGFVR